MYDNRAHNIVELNNYKVSEIEKYQDYIIAINHAFIRYVGEVNDVYSIILDSSESPDKFLKNFMNHYRFNLINDMRRAKNMKSSFKFLQRYKDTLLSLNTSFKTDLKTIDNHIKELEIKEAELLSTISKST